MSKLIAYNPIFSLVCQFMVFPFHVRILSSDAAKVTSLVWIKFSPNIHWISVIVLKNKHFIKIKNDFRNSVNNRTKILFKISDLIFVASEFKILFLVLNQKTCLGFVKNIQLNARKCRVIEPIHAFKKTSTHVCISTTNNGRVDKLVRK